MLEPTPEEERAQNLEKLYQHVQNSVKRLQMRVGENMGLNKEIGLCLENRCKNLTEQATEVIEKVSDRKVKSELKKQYFLDPETFISKKITSIEEASTFERAASCMNECKLPLEIVKRIMSSNVSALQTNIHECAKSCEFQFNVHGDPDNEKLFETELYDCRVNCLERNKEIMNENIKMKNIIGTVSEGVRTLDET